MPFSESEPARVLWLVGNSRYGTIDVENRRQRPRLWLVGNSRYGTMHIVIYYNGDCYGV